MVSRPLTFRLFLKTACRLSGSGALALEDERSAGKTFLEAGFVYVSCGCRGRSSLNQEGVRCGKSPLSLVDLKAGIRFLKHLAGVIPGDMEKIISVGISAGGAMSSLLGVTGDSPL